MRKFYIIITTIAAFFFIVASPLSALTRTSFNAGYIIDDQIFFNKDSMTVSQIQGFLNSKVASCDTNHASSVGDSGTIYSAPFVCLKDYYENPNATYQLYYNGEPTPRTFYRNNSYEFTSLTPYIKNGITYIRATIKNIGGLRPEGSISAAQIIYNTAQKYNINPQVLIVTLQKEQGLITDTWPAAWQYQSAMGYACPDNGPCSGKYAGFSTQIDNAAWQFRDYVNNPQKYNFASNTTRKIYYNPGPYDKTNSRYFGRFGDKADIEYCGSSNIYIQNQATAILYNYTPYQPNTAVLANMNDTRPGGSDTCGAYGNLNFFWYFTKWFGSTYSSVYNGVDYSAVFDATFYLTNNPDVNTAFGGNYYLSLQHFVNYGMKEGRQAIADFNVYSYKNQYWDLRLAFGGDLRQYYLHYMYSGKKEGRVATNTGFNAAPPIRDGVDYSSVYDFNYYKSKYSDVSTVFGNDENAMLTHFINSGMREGRQAIADFNVYSYKNTYWDLRAAFGGDLKQYYLHYMYSGKKEGRVATSPEFNGTSVMNGIDYSAVYNFSFYQATNLDVANAFKFDDVTTLRHFVQSGMKEGRQAISTFNPIKYKNRYYDLQQAFGGDLKMYYLHYMYSGLKEGRLGA